MLRGVFLFHSKATLSDGLLEAYNTIVACTGFRITFLFFDPDLIDSEHVEHVPLYRKMMHASYPNIYFIGWRKPLADASIGLWPLQTAAGT